MIYDRYTYDTYVYIYIYIYMIGIYDRYLIGFVPPHGFGIPEVYG